MVGVANHGVRSLGGKFVVTFSDRILKLRRKFEENEIDGFFVSQPENRYYLSGFYGSEGYIIGSSDRVVLAVDYRYYEQAKRQCPDYEIFQISGSLNWFNEITSSLNIKHLGFESSNVTWSFYRQLTDVIKANNSPLHLKPVNGIVESLRIIKEPEEISYIKKAIEISDSAIEHIKQYMCPGMTEVQVAWIIEKYMRENGSETIPFEIIVGGGINSALPHALPSDYCIQNGDSVVIDIGARYKRYVSDSTRSFSIGDQDETFKKIYDIVLGAHLTAIVAIKAGMNGEEADGIARSVIREGGYAEFFGHSLGHGVGLATHEAPRLGMRSTDVLKDGMVFTIEPGIYIPGWGGVRIEDTVIMENGQVKSLSRLEK